MYTYNKKGLSDHLNKKTFSQRSLETVTNSSLLTIGRWARGEDIYISKLLKICNHYKIPLGDFIRENDYTVSSVFTNNPQQTEAIRSLTPEQNANVAEIMKYEEQMKGMKEDYENRISKMEKDFLERIGDVRESAAERWTKKNAEALMNERRSLEDKYDEKMNELREEVIKLREENAVLKFQLDKSKSKRYVATDVLSEQDVHSSHV